MTTIYLYTCRINGKVYVGKTNQTLENRDRQHRGGTRTVFDRALRKHTPENFTLEVLATVETAWGSYTEMLFIAGLKSNDRRLGYNVTSGGEGTLDHHHREETKQAIAIKMTGRIVTDEFRKRIGKLKTGNTYNAGRRLSPKHCLAISLRSIGNQYAKGAVRSPETRQKMSVAAALRESAKRAKPPATHCSKGHLYTPATIYVWNNRRMCETCRIAIRAKKKKS
jgi:group I intron endonuclease